MVRELLKWTDKKFENVVDDPDQPNAFAKAVGLGAIEGMVDAVAVIGTLGLIGGIISMFKK